MRAHLLTTTAAVGLLAATSAQAQDATWLLNPGSGSFNTATNWNPAVVPTNTAIFGASNTTFHNNVDRNAAVQPWCACLYFLYVFASLHINQYHRYRHR